MQENTFRKKQASGWSLPLRDKNATALYAKTISGLYKFYAQSNRDLYRLIETELGGERSGWTGTFPTSPRRTPKKEGAAASTL